MWLFLKYKSVSDKVLRTLRVSIQWTRDGRSSFLVAGLSWLRGKRGVACKAALND